MGAENELSCQAMTINMVLWTWIYRQQQRANGWTRIQRANSCLDHDRISKTTTAVCVAVQTRTMEL